MKRSVSISLLILCLSSCKKESFLTDNERTVLFAEPSAPDIIIARNEWQQRDLNPAGYTVRVQKDIGGGTFQLKIVSYTVRGQLKYGLLIIPATGNVLPVRMLASGFELGATTTSVNMVLNSGGGSLSYILAVPAMPGESLAVTVNGITYTSPPSAGNHCDAFDAATDDVISFLNLIEQTETRADVNRTGIRGGSRGGTVALLAGIRDSRIKRVVNVAGPTDMLSLTSVHENDPTYQCQFLSAFKNGGATIAATRQRMIASSPFYFAQHLPLTQLHLGLRDTHVPIAQGYALEQKINLAGTASNFQIFSYDRTHTDIATYNTLLADRIEAFFSQL